MDAMPASSPAELPLDLAFEILLRFPVRDLVRFKSVCKSWRSLIESPAFISRHLNRSSISCGDGKKGGNAARSLIVKYHCQATEECRVSLLSGQTLELNTPVEAPPHLHSQSWRMVGCCNGVVCLYNGGRYLLWNPATREYRILPECRIPLSSTQPHTVCYGFGYDSAIDGYKIVRIVADLGADKSCVRVEVFTLSEGSWREIPPTLAEWQFYSCRCVSLGGCLYWAVAYAFQDDHQCILSFDLRDEVFRQVRYPDHSLVGYKRHQRLAYDEESLFLMVFNYTANDTVLDLWVMEGGPGEVSWTKRWSIGAMRGIHKPLGCGLNWGILVEKNHGMLAIYEADKERVRGLPVKGVRCSLDCQFYIESLVRVIR